MKRQQGATLIIALVFLLLITLFGVSSMRSSNLNLMMANNEQLRIEAAEKSQAIIDSVINDPDNLTVTGSVGHVFCDQADADPACNSTNMTVPVAVTTMESGETIDYRAIRRGPETSSAPALGEDAAYSAAAYKATYFEVQANYDGTDLRRGRSDIAQGVMILIPGS